MENQSRNPLDKAGVPFGTLADGRVVSSYELKNQNGVILKVIDYGCIITSLIVPVHGNNIDVVLGFDTLDDYLTSHTLPAPPYFGAVIGRYSGRIKNGSFNIGENHYQLPVNNGTNTLHGGPQGFDKILWDLKSASSNAITFEYISKDGDQNFPGELTVRVSYSITDGDEILIEYSAIADQDTVINLTQHSYFNLDGHTGNILDQKLTINSRTLLETDSGIVPTGRFIEASVKGFDFRSAAKPPSEIDDSFIIEDTSIPAAILQSQNTGLRLTVLSDQPSLHIYIGGNLFDMVRGKAGVAYHPHSGICFESQNYPDAPNHSHFPNSLLKAGQTYRQETRWKFDIV